MTPEQIEMHRKRFEEIIKSLKVVKYSLDKNEHDEYRQAAVFHMWSGYLLCAENMEVELPDSWFSENHQEYILSNSELEKYLESQGIKVKP